MITDTTKSPGEAMVPVLQDAIRAMRPRERAILRVMKEIEISGVCHMSPGMVADAPLTSLYEDPSLRGLIVLWDLALAAEVAAEEAEENE